MTSEVMAQAALPVHAAEMQKLLLPLAGFILFSVYTAIVAMEHGPLGFIPEHMRGGWAMQVFIDLVLGLTGFLVIARSDARRRGITFWPYVAATIFLGSIGMLAYFVRRGLSRDPMPG